MSRRYPTPPEKKNTFDTGCGCWGVTLVIAVIFGVLALNTHAWGYWLIFVVCMICFIAEIVHAISQWKIRMNMNRWLKNDSTRGLLILPGPGNANDYIQKHWIPRFGDKLKVVKLSDKEKWLKTPDGGIWRMCYWSPELIKPSIILTLEDEDTFVHIRYTNAFRDYRMGNRMAVEALEYYVCKELGLSLTDWQDDLELIEDALEYFRRFKKKGMAITSNTTSWKKYFESNWHPKFTEDFEIYNWSERRYWLDNPATKLYYRLSWLEGKTWPVIIQMHGFGQPLIRDFNEFWFSYNLLEEKSEIHNLENEVVKSLDEHDFYSAKRIGFTKDDS